MEGCFKKLWSNIVDEVMKLLNQFNCIFDYNMIILLAYKYEKYLLLYSIIKINKQKPQPNGIW